MTRAHSRIDYLQGFLLSLILALPLLPALTRVRARFLAEVDASTTRHSPARLSDRVSVSAAGHANPKINLSDGREVLTSYAGAAAQQQALEQNTARPLSLASADFDEDGVPDLISGYADSEHGIVTVLRGSVAAIYPNAAEAKQPKQLGTFIETPFLSPARVYASAIAPDFIGAGDFDGDGHADVIVAARNGRQLVLLPGDGKGGLGLSQAIDLPGLLTTLVTGEINRPDGLTDIVCGVVGVAGPQLLIFEGAVGAFTARPEVLPLSSAATALALGQLDDEPEIDLIVSAGRDLVLVHGRDRKLSVDSEQRTAVPAAEIEARPFTASLKSVAIGNFAGDERPDIAVLADDGVLQLLVSQRPNDRQRNMRESRIAALSQWSSEATQLGGGSVATEIVRARVSTLTTDALIVVEPDRRQLQILTTLANEPAMNSSNGAGGPAASAFQVATLSTLDSGPVAVLPMRLNSDGLSDLVTMNRNRTAPTVIRSATTTILVVNSAADTDDGLCDAANCTLREALAAANANPGADTINFSIGTGAQTIVTSSPLPLLDDAVTLDGTTQPGFSGAPLIDVRDELNVYSSNSLIRGLVVQRINLRSHSGSPTSGNTIEGNYLGAVNITGPTDNLIGGPTTQARNIVGTVTVESGLTSGSGNVIQGNYIGTDVTGTIGSGGGVTILTGSSQTIGGNLAGTGNLIMSGVAIRQDVSGVLIQGNLVGTDVSGARHLGAGKISLNGNASVMGIHGVTIGGTTKGARNVISDGISLSNEEVAGTLIQGNYIGVDATGTAALGNSGDGVQIQIGSHGNTIGGEVIGARNIISGNAGRGVSSGNAPGDESPNYIEGNFIGTDASGTKALGNGGDGISIFADGHAATSIGGTTSETANVIANNGGAGIHVSGLNPALSFVGIQNNFIGTDLSGSLQMGNAHDGVLISSGANQVYTANNIVAFNHGNGVNVPGTDTGAASGSRIIANSIYANSELGINLGDPGITENDPLDVDIGANKLQNFPLLTAFALSQNVKPQATGKAESDSPRTAIPGSASSGFFINGTLNSTPNTTYTVHWYFSSDSQCGSNQLKTRPLAAGEVANVTTDASGNAAFSFPFSLPAGYLSGVLNATATDSDGNTSESSPCVAVTAPPPTYVISGRVTDGGNGLADVTVTMSGDYSGTTLTDAAGNYSFTGLTAGGNYMVTLAKPNYTFSPVNMPINNLTANQSANFIATLRSMQFAASSYSTTEGSPFTVTITRSGDSSAPATVDYATVDGTAEQRSDYLITAGTLSFGPGEMARSFDVLITDDSFVEGAETLSLRLGNATGGALNGPSTVTLTILDNDSQSASTNPLDDLDGQFFVREHYYDFLNRAPDPGGLSFWSGMIAQCGSDQTCRRQKRIDVSNAFFQELEYQQTGAYVFRLYRLAFGNNQPLPNPFGDPNHANEEKKLPSYAAFSGDRARVIGGANLAQGQIDLANAFVMRPEFLSRYPASLATAGQFVDAVLATIQADIGVDLSSQRSALVSLYDSGGRGAVLYRLADDNAPANPIDNRVVIDAEYNRAFVATQYFGYLRRDADIEGFLFWLGQVNSAALRDVARQHAMVCSFITAAEYQYRFSPIALHNNSECQP